MSIQPRVGLRIWDWPTRLFHWLLAVLIAAAWWTAEEEELVWHSRIGMAVFGLIVFRLIWGLIGGSTARFAGFVRGPRAIAAYLRGSGRAAIGHNPLGALSVLALLGMVGLIVGLGLFATDEDGIQPGPLSHLIGIDAAETATELHEDLFNPLLALIALHVAAILYYAVFKRTNLLGPMLVGTGSAPEGAAPMRPAPAWRFVLAAAFATAAAWWIGAGA